MGRRGPLPDQGAVLPQPGAGEEPAGGERGEEAGRVALHRHDGRLLRAVERRTPAARRRVSLARLPSISG